MTIFFRQPGPKSRTAGVVAPAVVATAPALPQRTSFSTDVWGDAFWFMREPASPSGPGTLYVSSGIRVLRDVRGELGFPASPLSWTAELLERLRDRLIALGAPNAGWVVPEPGEVLSRGWLAWALWFTYGREWAPRNPDVIVLPYLLTTPVIGVLYEGVGGTRSTGAVMPFDVSTLSSNPFAQPVHHGDAVGVVGGGSSGGPLAALFLALAVLAGGESS